MLAIFRADAGPEIGGGHAFRSLALATALRDVGWRCQFATVSGSIGMIPALAPFTADGTLLRDDEYASPEALMNRWPDGCDLFVCDHYNLDAAYETALRNWAKRIAVIDDSASRIHDCDILIDHNDTADRAGYKEGTPAHCAIFLGPRYALLRPGFSEINRDGKKTGRRAGSEHIFICFGTNDRWGLTGASLDALASLNRDVSVDVVLGHTSENLEETKSQIRDLPFKARLYVDPPDMAALMAVADIAVGAAGSTSWERCAAGLPSVVVEVAANQAPVRRNLNRSGVAICLDNDERILSSLAAALEELLGNVDRRNRMATAARHLCDGRGARRIARIIDGTAAADGKPVFLRPALQSDAELMYGWQQAPSTRRFARNSNVPSWEEHCAWLKKALASRERQTWIVLHGSDPAGVIRLDPVRSGLPAELANREVLEVSILVAPDRYRKGIGLAALRLAREAADQAVIIATVLEDNRGSEALFQRAGYKRELSWYVSLPENSEPLSVPAE